MPNVTFESPLLHKNVTVYAIAGDTSTVLAVAEANKVAIPHDCRDGECGSCLIEVVTLSGKTMGRRSPRRRRSQIARQDYAGRDPQGGGRGRRSALPSRLPICRARSGHFGEVHRRARRRLKGRLTMEFCRAVSRLCDPFGRGSRPAFRPARRRYGQLRQSRSRQSVSQAFRLFAFCISPTRGRAPAFATSRRWRTAARLAELESPETAAIWAADPFLGRNEALEIALAAEQAGYDYYKKVLDETTDPEVKNSGARIRRGGKRSHRRAQAVDRGERGRKGRSGWRLRRRQIARTPNDEDRRRGSLT